MSNAERMRAWRASLTEQQQHEQAVKAQRRVKEWRLRNGRKDNQRTAAARARKAKWKKLNAEKVARDSMERIVAKLRSKPSWSDSEAILRAYDMAKQLTQETGFAWHVDHIVPLRSPIVCGLHIETNLQVLPANDNMKKSNKFWPDMPEVA